MNAMTILGSLIFSILLSATSQATVDGMTVMNIVTEPIHEETFQIRSVPTEACYGIEYGPQTVAFTKPFFVTGGMGCGMPGKARNINAASCASAKYTWNAEYTKVLHAKIDISKCRAEYKSEPSFRPVIRKAAKMNFGDQLKVTFSE